MKHDVYLYLYNMHQPVATTTMAPSSQVQVWFNQVRWVYLEGSCSNQYINAKVTLNGDLESINLIIKT